MNIPPFLTINSMNIPPLLGCFWNRVNNGIFYIYVYLPYQLVILPDFWSINGIYISPYLFHFSQGSRASGGSGSKGLVGNSVGTGSSEGVKGAMAEESKSEIDAEAEGPGCTAPARWQVQWSGKNCHCHSLQGKVQVWNDRGLWKKTWKKNILCPPFRWDDSPTWSWFMLLENLCSVWVSQIPLLRLRPFSGYPVYPSESPEHSIARYHAKWKVICFILPSAWPVLPGFCMGGIGISVSWQRQIS